LSDEALRALERRWGESGSTQDEAALLLERARVGQLSEEALELAAYCGHPAALLARSEPLPGPAEELELQAWFEGLRQRGRALFAQAAHIAASGVVDHARSLPPPPADEQSPPAAPSAVEEWVACPCRAHLLEVLEAGSNAVEGTPLADANWCAVATVQGDAGPLLMARVIQRSARGAEVALREVRVGLIQRALARDPAQ